MFPAKYDFYDMLREQAEVTCQGVETVLSWLNEPTIEKFNQVIALTIQADMVRIAMEENLIDAFSTPFDRQDIYEISVRMDRIIEHARFAMQSIKEYEVDLNRYIIKMAQELSRGTKAFSESVSLLSEAPIEARNKIQLIRDAHYTTVDYYKKGMAIMFKSDNPMNALKHYEIYSQFREAAHCLNNSVDVLHRIVVRLV
jgi:uncharacterized protein Yka (UPF0111/DUF47 family)